jgi:HAD superfamily hydrolase (TIGR01509 family)
MEIGLIFDMDGVIIDNHHFHHKAWLEVGKKYGKKINSEDYREHMNGRTLNEVVRFIFNETMTEERVREVGHEKEALYRQLYQPYVEPVKGLLALLSEANLKGIPMVVGTSAPVENVIFTMNGLGIRHYFVDILDERAVTKGKPNPEIYQKCAKRIGLPNDHCIVFEDAISGIKAGKSAGSKVVALATSHGRDELNADLVVDNFESIHLERLFELIKA